MKLFSERELRDIDFHTLFEIPYDSAYDLHMGSCDLFAKVLHDIYGYEMCRINYGNSFHMFCRAEKNGRIVYIDASGMSYNLQDLQPNESIDLEDVYSVEEVPCDGEYDIFGLKFAECFINAYSEYFDIDQM